jgi:hypothetical protein
MNINAKLTLILSIFVLSLPASAETVGKWQRFATTYANTTWEGNPFDVAFQGEFTSPSGRKLTHWGFYAGGDEWSLYFMPDEVGAWRYETRSPDPELDGKVGKFECVPSGLPGKLETAGTGWRLSDSEGDAPILWNPPTSDGAHWAFRGRAADDPTVVKALKFADEVVGARVIGFHELFVVSTGWAKDWPQDSLPYVGGREGDEFYLPFWNRLNEKLDAVRERGMGHYIMIYGDDEMKPDRYGVTPSSLAEKRYFRYLAARLAPYPIVLWDTGIDIGEYRSNQWIEGFAVWFNENDPWGHPTGSRAGGGSGGTLPPSATYYSVGGAGLPGRSEFLGHLALKVPTAHTDHWRPFINRGDWSQEKIRAAVWHGALAGGQAVFPDYNQGPVDQAEVRIGSAYIGHATRFFRNELQGDIRDLKPSDHLIVAGEEAILAANPGIEYVLYDRNGGEVTLDLQDLANRMSARWHNPKTGESTRADAVLSGTKATFSAPSKGPAMDWVLHITAGP